MKDLPWNQLTKMDLFGVWWQGVCAVIHTVLAVVNLTVSSNYWLAGLMAAIACFWLRRLWVETENLYHRAQARAYREIKDRHLGLDLY